MEIYSPNLFIEINSSEYIFIVGDKNENDHFRIIYKNIITNQAISDSKIIDFDLAYNTIKKNLYLMEQELNYTFKEIILIIDNFNCSFVNLAGYKKLNGSQILKENITYILNSLKSNIDEFEDQKTILHIFNSKYCLDKKNIENIPIGLFGDFYSQELSFNLINNNDFNNLNNIFDKCNLKIKKILLKSFVEGAYLSNKNPNIDTFFLTKINENNSKIFFFENNALKFEQNFSFGSNLVINDISKITSLNKSIVKKILSNSKLTEETLDQELVEKELFENENYRKIKKKLIFEIAAARIKELSEVLIKKNINFENFHKKDLIIFLKIKDRLNLECFKNSYSLYFSKNNYFTIKFINSIETNDLVDNANTLVNYGWKKEAVPVIQPKKSLIVRLFDTIFN
jgi:cell division protein FtsA